MAFNPNFAFKAANEVRASNPGLAKQYLDMVPKCAQCGTMVSFLENGTQRHIGQPRDAQGNKDNHEPNATRPTDEQLIAIGHPRPEQTAKVAAMTEKPARAARTPRTPAEPASSTNPIVKKGRAKLGPQISQGQRTRINTIVGNRNLGRQFNPNAYDAEGLMRSAADIFNGGSQEGNR